MSITVQEALTRTIEHREIFHDEMLDLMRQIMSGQISPVMIAAIIVGLRVKKETIGEITAAAQVMRELATRVTVKDPDNLVDIVGTGGDGAHTFNISTASMFVCAAAGGRVAKHGNRAVSSQSGSADVLEALGANINLKPEQVSRCIDEIGLGGEAGAWGAHPVQHFGAAHQSGRRVDAVDGSFSSRSGRNPGPGSAATRGAPRNGRLRLGRLGRDLGERPDDDRRVEKR